MIAHPLPARTPEEIARLVRALGSHRYVAGRLILMHAFVFEALASTGIEELREACAWATAILREPEVDPSSRDPRLHRPSTEKELAAALGVFWSDKAPGDHAREALRARLHAIEAPIEPALFDESREDDLFPVLIDAGWELLSLRELDPERHRGVIDAFGEAFPSSVQADDGPTLHELPALGPAELLDAAAHGILRVPLVLWTSGEETYNEYVLRGVLRAAKLS